MRFTELHKASSKKKEPDYLFSAVTRPYLLPSSQLYSFQAFVPCTLTLLPFTIFLTSHLLSFTTSQPNSFQAFMPCTLRLTPFTVCFFTFQSPGIFASSNLPNFTASILSPLTSYPLPYLSRMKTPMSFFQCPREAYRN